MSDEIVPANVARTPTSAPYMLRRLGIVMRPEPGLETEAGGVLNPGGARGPDGEYYLFPRLVGAGNYSRIGIARVVHDDQGIPRSVERLGVVLEPEQAYERNAVTGGGCEDPRVTFMPHFGAYIMTYVAYGPLGPRVAFALSTDLFTWRRLGLIEFAPLGKTNMNVYGNKDAIIFPDLVPGPDGRPAIAMIHRPMYEIWRQGEPPHGVVADSHAGLKAAGTRQPSSVERAPAVHTDWDIVDPPEGVQDRRWTMWISFCPLDQAGWANPTTAQPGTICFQDHQPLVLPDQPWEALRLGGGTPPIVLDGGWFTIYHGIGVLQRAGKEPGLRYSAGALVLDSQDPRKVLYRSHEPILEPMTEEEQSGVVSNVVFPTAVDVRDGYLDVYYGMADAAIGVARLDFKAS